MPDSLSTSQIAEAVKLHRQSVWRAAVAGKLPGAKLVGDRWRIPARYADPAAYRAAVGAWGGRRERSE